MSFQPVIDTLTKTLFQIIDFIPRLINGLIILIIGYLISWVIRWIIRFILHHIGLDRLADRTNVHNAMRGLTTRVPFSEIIAQTVFFFLILSFATSAVALMGLDVVAQFLRDVLLFFPRAISAALLLIFGSLLAHFLGNTITEITENANITYARALGKILEYAILAFVIVLAISTLGVDTTVLTTSLTIIIAAAGLALALTFAWGSREAARNVIAGYYVRQNFRPGQQLTLGDYSGRIRSTSGAYTILEVTGGGGSSTISLPNTLLLQNAVTGQESITSESSGNNPGTTGSEQAGS